MQKYVYMFEEGNATMRELLGGKGANLAEMINLGLPVPDGFTVTTEACTKYYEDGEVVSPEVEDQVKAAMKKLEENTGKEFGNPDNSLLVSVRSGSRASMPGMMDTVLNLGLNDEVVDGLAKASNNRRFALDSYRRFIMMFGDVVMEIDKSNFDNIFDSKKEQKGIELDTDLTAEDLAEIVSDYKEIYKELTGSDFPTEPIEQLLLSIRAVFRSWNNPRAIYYRRMNNIPASWGTAVNIQEMVYGNIDDSCGTGVAFTRNPADGKNELYGEYLMNAQGEDVVAGVRTPSPISQLEEQNIDLYNQFKEIGDKLEKHYGDMQDLEFTIERGKLFILQTRNGKRTAQAALKIAVEMVEEGIVDKKQALLTIDPNQLNTLLHPQFDEEALEAATPIAKGLPASPGAATGEVVFTAQKATEEAETGKAVILVRDETSAEDIEGMHASAGILTVRGGMTSHAAVVARGMGTCCVAGCSDVSIDEEACTMEIAGVTYKEGEKISIDGSTGNVYAGEIPTVEAELSEYMQTVMEWVDEIRVLKVRTNADSAEDSTIALRLGAEGIGLTRTEHMFFAADRILAFRQMIVADNEEERRKALAEILPVQQSDFEAIFEVMKGKPVTIRLLDPPLHEFLPTAEADIQELADALDMDIDRLKAKINSLQEINPMLGHRGCRLAISYPEIAEMQTAAIIGAALAKSDADNKIVPEIMVPLVGDVKEFEFLHEVISNVADKLIAESGKDLEYHIGTMIEIPRAALTSEKIAKVADFFSYGTNDLTQMSYGLSRDDAGKILDVYIENGIYENDPTANLDLEGVGRLMKISAEEGRLGKPDISLGICGEHGGDPSAVEYCHELGFDYVSCSPYRVPIAKLAAAQAQINNPR
ncbi:MAG: pyruvate, phosphate dikinase [Clostridiaceae bacterium]|nr:pyruvate, phosphate dikinase [Clostridiaceae bacterium]